MKFQLNHNSLKLIFLFENTYFKFAKQNLKRPSRKNSKKSKINTLILVFSLYNGSGLYYTILINKLILVTKRKSKVIKMTQLLNFYVCFDELIKDK